MEIEKIEIEKVCPSPMNPRKTFDEGSLTELADNIEKQGLLQPITVRAIEYYDSVEPDGEISSVPTRYEIICGERRYRAMRLLNARNPQKFGFIAAIVRDMTDDEAFEAMITENLQRKDVDPIEEAFAFAKLSERGVSTSELAAKFGKSIRFILDRIKLNNLIPELQQWVRDESMPLSGGVLVSKLSKEEQKDFHESFIEQIPITLTDVKGHLDRLFMELDNKPFYNDDNIEGMPKCDKCQFNTSNQGCLFYEMKGRYSQCTNRDCYEKKSMEYIVKKVRETKNVLMKGEKMDFDKVMIVSSSNIYVYDEKRRKKYDELLQRLDKLGYCIVDMNNFSSRCWYDESDERYKEKIANHECYECITFDKGYSMSFGKQLFWAKNETVKSITSPNPITEEINTLINERKRAREKCNENISGAFRAFAGDCDYGSNGGDFTETEQIVFDAMILRKCDYHYLDKIGADRSNDAEFMRYVKENLKDRAKWYREFMRGIFQSTDIIYNGTVRECAKDIFNELYADDAKAIIGKYEKTLQKKLNKIDERLKELGYKE